MPFLIIPIWHMPIFGMDVLLHAYNSILLFIDFFTS